MRKTNVVVIGLIIVAGILLYLRRPYVIEPIDYKFVKIGMSGETMDKLDCENKEIIEEARESGSRKNDYLKTITVRTREELEQSGWSNSTLDSYDDAYFEKNNLCILIMEEGNGGNIYGVRSITREKNNVINIEIINYSYRVMGTCVMEYTMGLIEVSKKHFNDDTISNGVRRYIQKYPEEDVRERNM